MLKSAFGTDRQGKAVEVYTLSNAKGTEAKIATLGAILVSWNFKDKNGVVRDVVLGYDDAADYLKGTCYFGATIGRSSNRIAGGKIVINGVDYQLEQNDGDNNLHSGSNGMHAVNWDVDAVSENSITLKYLSADGEQDFPGNMTVKLTYTLSDDDELTINYEAVSDKDTVANFTNHSYFNLGGHDSGDIFGQKLKIYADAFNPVTPTGSIPTGELRLVEGTPFDFREFKEIGKDADADYDQLSYTGGYDHNFVLDDKKEVRIMAEAICEETGIHLYGYTDCPGVQLYASNFVNGEKGKGGAVYNIHQAFCLESQYFPDSINNPAFETPLLKAGDVYKSTTIYKLALD
ncbi:MAG: galactose mutarotase [Lachnospiraceae bacterium]|nr:galactose mutarotase [Lachnospiraceae bacterium]